MTVPDTRAVRIAIARVVLETLKVELAAARLVQIIKMGETCPWLN